ncbi:MAG: methylmalonyl-CoA mutase family protein [Syntrophomonadaceae bacterium]|nr:methylmalonyl-CoA mutase family protein [Syntrophomonadaceae bacterium]
MDKWNQKVEKTLSKQGERKEKFVSSGFNEVNRMYTPLDIQGSYNEKIGFPGEYPFTRGPQNTMYRGKLWTMRMYAGFSTAEESNKRYKYLLENGGSGLSVAFDLPTQIGYDSDHPMSEGEVGKVGVAIDSLADMEILFDGIPLDKVSTSMTINAPASILLAMYIAVAEKQGVPLDKLRGTIQNDILKEYAARGTYIFPVQPSMRLITNIFEYCSQHVPQWNTISISGYHIREAGSTAVDEIAFTLADGIAYVKAAIKAGMDIDTFAGRLSFFLNAHNNLLEEAAKFRAARRLWAYIMKEYFGAKDPRSWTFRTHSQTAGSMLTAQQVNNNIARVCIQAMAAVLGGTQSLHTNSKDEALALPSEESVMTALRTQQIIAYESGIADTVDPLAGSYYVEALTDKIYNEAWEKIQKIEEMGGAEKAIEMGYIQTEIQKAAYQWQKEVESGERVIVGVNKFQVEEPEPTGLLKVDPSVRDAQIEKLKKLRETRDNIAVGNRLEELRKAARGEENMMPYILNAVRAYATEGEICGVLREEWGEYVAAVTI